MKTYLNGSFIPLWHLYFTSNNFNMFQDESEVPSDCDLVGVTFFTNSFTQHTNTVINLSKKTKKLLVLVSEPTDPSFKQFLYNIDLPNVFVFGDSVLNFDYPKFQTLITWFIRPVRNIYATDSWYINQISMLNPYTFNKPKKFDCLLGSIRKHRDMIEFLYSASLIKDQIIFNYFKKNIENGIWEQELIPDQVLALHHPIPLNIYNQSYYSIIAETTDFNEFSQITEKTAKPVVSRRVFIAFCGQYFLRNLRSLGFKTFDSIIDESYDLIADRKTRISAAWEQVEYLSLQDPETTITKVKDILEYNYQHFIRNDWNSAVVPYLK